MYNISRSLSLSLSQADQLMFAMHFVKGMHPELFQENVSLIVSCGVSAELRDKWNVEIIASELWNVNLSRCRNGMSSLDPS